MTLSFYHDRISGIGKLEENWNCILKCKKKTKQKKTVILECSLKIGVGMYFFITLFSLAQT